MPTTGHRFEDTLIDLFLSVYDSRSWSSALTTRVSPERTTDGAVEMIATRTADGATLAIEHTLIEPFVGEKSDFHKHFKVLAEQLRADPSLVFPGHALYVNAPVNVLPNDSKWQAIIKDVVKWLRTNARSFGSSWQEADCPSPSHPNGTITFQVRLQPLGNESRPFPPIVQRYGEMKIGDSVRKALENKLPKLARANAMKRLLMLEREQGWIAYETICTEIDNLRPRFTELSRVDEIWIADTATFGATKEYVDFRWQRGEELLESFTFYRGRLESMSKNGLPLMP